MNRQTKYVVFTLNRGCEAFHPVYEKMRSKSIGLDVVELTQMQELFGSTCTYVCVSVERGLPDGIEDRGNLHIQGYAEYNSKKRLSTYARYTGLKGGHVETRAGKSEQASDYVMCRGAHAEKDRGDLNLSQLALKYEFGDREVVQPGKRTDLDSLKQDINDGHSLWQISEDHFGAYLRYESGIKNKMALNVKDRDFLTECYIFWGETGTGKSLTALRLARELTGGDADKIYNKDGTKWWPFYNNGHQVVIVDDFNGEWAFEQWKKVCDRYPLQVQNKGGYVKFTSRTIIFTSNVDPTSWFKDLPPHRYEELSRRCLSIVHFRAMALTDDGWVIDHEIGKGDALPVCMDDEGRPWDQ